MLNVAVIGVGGWGINHVRVLRSFYGTLVNDLIVVDINEERGRYAARIYGAKYYKNINEAFKRESIDAAIISTPTHLHYEHASLALKSGIHVLIEKPMTDTLDKALKLYDLAKNLNLILMVGFIMRYHPLVEYFKNNILKNNILGKVLVANSKRTSWWPNRPWDAGVVKDLAIHDVDLLHYLLKEKAKTILAHVGSLKHSYYEDFATMLISYESYTALFEANWITPYKIRYLSLTGEKAVTNLDFVSNELIVYTENEIVKPRIPFKEPLLLEDNDFLNSIVKGRKPKVSAADGIRALAVCEAALRSAIRRAPMEIEYPL